MNIGKLYQIKRYFWLLYPSKDIAVAAADTYTSYATWADDYAAYYSNRFKCNVSYIEPNSVFCLLEQDGKYYKVLTTNGELGWIYCPENQEDWTLGKDSFEEVNQ